MKLPRTAGELVVFECLLDGVRVSAHLDAGVWLICEDELCYTDPPDEPFSRFMLTAQPDGRLFYLSSESEDEDDSGYTVRDLVVLNQFSLDTLRAMR